MSGRTVPTFLPTPEEPVAGVHRSAEAQTKARTQTLPDGTPAHSYQGLLAHLGTRTRTRNTMEITGTTGAFDLLAILTPTQHQAAALIQDHINNHRK